jgi:hypothetical protein
MQIFHRQHVVVTHETVCHLVMPVTANALNLAVPHRETTHGLAAAPPAAGALADHALRLADTSTGTAQGPSILEALAIARGEECFESEIDPDVRTGGGQGIGCDAVA